MATEDRLTCEYFRVGFYGRGFGKLAGYAVCCLLCVVVVVFASPPHGAARLSFIAAPCSRGWTSSTGGWLGNSQRPPCSLTPPTRRKARPPLRLTSHIIIDNTQNNQTMNQQLVFSYATIRTDLKQSDGRYLQIFRVLPSSSEARGGIEVGCS